MLNNFFSVLYGGSSNATVASDKSFKPLSQDKSPARMREVERFWEALEKEDEGVDITSSMALRRFCEGLRRLRECDSGGGGLSKILTLAETVCTKKLLPRVTNLQQQVSRLKEELRECRQPRE